MSTPDLRPSLLSILVGLHDSGFLRWVVTTLAVNHKQVEWWSQRPLLGPWLHDWLQRRQLPEFLEGKTTCVGARELLRTLVARTGRERLTHWIWQWAETRFDAVVAQRYAGRYRYLYGMEHASATTFAAQRRGGGFCFLRQVSAHGRTINDLLRTEAERFPHYVTAYHRLLISQGDALVRRKEREYALAHVIVANSSYVRQTFLEHGVEAQKLVAIPTGCPPLDEVGGRAGREEGPLRFLYVGTLSLRKGFPYLLEAWQQFHPRGKAELWIAGLCEIPCLASLQREAGIHYLGMLSKGQLQKMYRQADVLVLPTLCEGMAHAALEALSYGLPIITTLESGCGELVTDGENGWIIPSRSVDALSSALEQALLSRRSLPARGNISRTKAGAWTIEMSNRAHLLCLQQFMQTVPESRSQVVKIE